LIKSSSRILTVSYRLDDMESRRRYCPLCKSVFKGRSDKKFCSIKCKSVYNYKLTSHTKSATKSIDKILHRNRSILQELMGKKISQKKVPLYDLEKKNFNFNYVTKYIVNKEGKVFNYVYDFAWMTFSTNEVLIVRQKQERKVYH